MLDFTKHKHMLCVLVILIVVVIVVIYFSNSASMGSCSDSCGTTQERIAYVKGPKERMTKMAPLTTNRMKPVERWVGADPRPPPSSDDYQMMKGFGVGKERYRNARERFSDDFDPPQITGMSLIPTPQSPYIGFLSNGQGM